MLSEEESAKHMKEDKRRRQEREGKNTKRGKSAPVAGGADGAGETGHPSARKVLPIEPGELVRAADELRDMSQISDACPRQVC